MHCSRDHSHILISFDGDVSFAPGTLVIVKRSGETLPWTWMWFAISCSERKQFDDNGGSCLFFNNQIDFKTTVFVGSNCFNAAYYNVKNSEVVIIGTVQD